MAADEPRNTKNSVNIQPSSLMFQSQAVVTRAFKMPESAGHATALEIPMARDSGSQNTEKP